MPLARNSAFWGYGYRTLIGDLKLEVSVGCRCIGRCIHVYGHQSTECNAIWICIAHNRGTSNVVYALVRCKQKRFQLFSKTISADGRVSQILWQWVPSRRACHRKSSSGKRTQPAAWYVEKLSAGGSETPPRCDCREWVAEVDQVLRCLAI